MKYLLVYRVFPQAVAYSAAAADAILLAAVVAVGMLRSLRAYYTYVKWMVILLVSHQDSKVTGKWIKSITEQLNS